MKTVFALQQVQAVLEGGGAVCLDWVAALLATVIKAERARADLTLTPEKIKAVQRSNPAYATCSCPAFARDIVLAFKAKQSS